MKSSGIALRKTKRRVAEFLTFLADIPGREKSRSGCQVMSAISLSTVLITSPDENRILIGAGWL